MPTIERDIVMQSKDENGNPTIDLPITRLGNVEDSAEIKKKPSEGDYLPIIDSEDNGQMKKVKVGDISLPANGGNASTVNGHTVEADVPADAKFTDTTYGNASTSAAGLVSTSAQTFAGNKTFNGQLIPNGASACGTPQARKLASGTAAANSTNCPPGAWYGQYE